MVGILIQESARRHAKKKTNLIGHIDVANETGQHSRAEM